MFVIFHVSSIKNPWPCAKEVAKLILSKIKLCSKADQRGKGSFKVLVHFPHVVRAFLCILILVSSFWVRKGFVQI